MHIYIISRIFFFILLLLLIFFLSYFHIFSCIFILLLVLFLAYFHRYPYILLRIFPSLRSTSTTVFILRGVIVISHSPSSSPTVRDSSIHLFILSGNECNIFIHAGHWRQIAMSIPSQGWSRESSKDLSLVVTSNDFRRWEPREMSWQYIYIYICIYIYTNIAIGEAKERYVYLIFLVSFIDILKRYIMLNCFYLMLVKLSVSLWVAEFMSHNMNS